jgi:hypothetical protein
LLIALIDEAEKLCTTPGHRLNLRVETRCTYISAEVPTSAFSER